jgi:hypothetical protein
MPRMANVNDDYPYDGGGLCPEDQIEKMACEGDFQGVWKLLLENEWGLLGRFSDSAQVRRAQKWHP